MVLAIVWRTLCSPWYRDSGPTGAEGCRAAANVFGSPADPAIPGSS